MTITELRRALMESAEDINRLRQEFAAEVQRMNAAISTLVAKADTLLVGEADELDAGTERTVKKVNYAGKATAEEVAEVLNPGRACGLCGERGHNKRTCPKADDARKKARKTKTKAQLHGAGDEEE